MGDLQLLVVHNVFAAALCKVLLEMCLHSGHPELQLLSKLLDAAHLDTADMTVLAASVSLLNGHVERPFGSMSDCMLTAAQLQLMLCLLVTSLAMV